MSKSYIVLRMYDILREGRAIRISDCCNGFKISIATFRRYMAFLRAYFAEVYGKEIIYDPADCFYRLK